MSPRTAQLLQEVIELPEQEKTAFAELLVENLDAKPDPEIERAWDLEIEERVRRADAGEIQWSSWDEIYARLAGRLNAAAG